MNQSRIGLFAFLLAWPILAGVQSVSAPAFAPAAVQGEHALTYGFPGERLPDRPAWERLLTPVAATQTRASLERTSHTGLPAARPEVVPDERCSDFPVPSFQPEGVEPSTPICERLPYDATAPPHTA